MNLNYTSYTCPQCGNGGAHPNTLPPPLCDKCDYKCTMIKKDVAIVLTAPPTTDAAPAMSNGVRWQVGEFWSSSRPTKKVLCLCVGDDIERDGARSDFIRWVSPTTDAAPTNEQKRAHIRSMIAAGCDLDAIGNRYNIVRKPGEPCADYRDRIQAHTVTDDLSEEQACAAAYDSIFIGGHRGAGYLGFKRGWMAKAKVTK